MKAIVMTLLRYTDEFGNVHKIKKQNHTEKERLM